MDMNKAMFTTRSKFTRTELQAAIDCIRRHKTYGDDEGARQERQMKKGRLKVLKEQLANENQSSKTRSSSQ